MVRIPLLMLVTAAEACAGDNAARVARAAMSTGAAWARWWTHRAASGPVFKEPERQESPVLFRQLSHGFIDQGFDRGPVERFVFRRCLLGSGGGALVTASGLFASHRVHGSIARDFHQPASHGCPVPQVFRFFRQDEEDGLRQFLSERLVAHLPKCRGVDEVHMPLDEFGKCILRPVIQVPREQFAVGGRLCDGV
jgi:hypothetical protein